jgi:hypothetical protein
MKMKVKFLLVFLLLIISNTLVFADQSDKELSDKINHLITYVEQSPNTFVRNGQEYDGKSAAKHIRDKYIYYKHSIRTPEEFIEKAASASMMTGFAYLVKLPDGNFVELKNWLLEELARFKTRAPKA